MLIYRLVFKIWSFAATIVKVTNPLPANIRIYYVRLSLTINIHFHSVYIYMHQKFCTALTHAFDHSKPTTQDAISVMQIWISHAAAASYI